MSKVRWALTGAIIVLMAAALPAMLVARSTHDPSITHAAPNNKHPTPTATPTNAPTNTPTATNTAINTPTNAPTATNTATNTPTNAPTATSIPTAPTATATAPTATSTPTVTSTSTIKTVFIILMENHNWSDIKGNPSAPYINCLISGANCLISGANDSQTSYATQYYNPPGNHPSLPNYLWLEGGQCFSYCGTDNSPSANPNGISSTQHLVMLLKNAGISWTAYEEGIADGICPMTGNYPYAPKHNPFVYFNDVNGDSTCTTHEKSFTDLSADLANNTVAGYNFITPNLCDDMHDSCSPLNDPIKQGDTWLQNNLPAILSSTAYKNGGAVFITWDEGEGGDGPIGMIVLSPAAKGNGYSNTIHYTHSSTLLTMEEIFGVSPLLGDAANATDLRDLFTAFP